MGLPKGSGPCQQFADAHYLNSLTERSSVDAIAIMQQITGALSHGKASAICSAVNSAVGWAVTLKWIARRRSWPNTSKTNTLLENHVKQLVSIGFLVVPCTKFAKAALVVGPSAWLLSLER